MEDTITPERVLSPERAEHLVLTTLSTHADALLRTARRYSLCHSDAEDAYQRGMEIFMRRAATLDPERASRWLHVVIRNEALAVRRSRGDVVASADFDAEFFAEGQSHESPEDRVLATDSTTRAAEALKRLKPHELRAMWLKALGKSYAEICAETGWSYTKVNRCLAEGRKSFLERYAGIEAGEECARWRPVLSAMIDGEATAEQLADARPHLRNCLACRATIRELHDASGRLSAVLPVAGLAGVGGGASASGADDGLPALGLLVRAWDAIGTFVGQRATGGALKAQAILDTTSSTKAVAVAASAAAIAGGGAVAVDHRPSHDRTPPASAVRAAPSTPRSTTHAATPAPTTQATTADPRSGTLVTTSARAAAAAAARHAAGRAAARARREAHEAAAATTAAEFDPVASTPTTSTASASREAAAVAGEFVESAGTPSSQTSSTKPSAQGNGGEFDP